MRTLFLTLLLVTTSLLANAQNNLSGHVYDDLNEPIPGATVTISKLSIGKVTDFNGFFSFNELSQGNYEIKISFVGYKEQVLKVSLPLAKPLRIQLQSSLESISEVVVEATRAGEKAPFTYSNISKEVLEGKNTGQDLPYLLNSTPSLVVSSDAGTGVGYTSMKIRGTDQSRINITVDGIPLNDSESQGVFWVNMPDFGSSVDNIQIQRGVGTSTNGAASFGATVNIQTATPNPESYAELNSSAGSFSTFKNTVKAGTGLMNGHYSFDVRTSWITSDGFIDRASSDLKSLYLSGGYFSENNVLKFNAFTGKEKTYQAWSGVPKEKVDAGDRTYNPEGEYKDKDGNVKYYDNQTDNYQQTHFQLFYTHMFQNEASLNVALHSTLGEGYYESYKDNKKPKDYGITGVSEKTDLIARKWLDNIFYGVTTSFKQPLPFGQFVVGGALNKYDGDHFGKVIWSETKAIPEDHEWYRGNGTKRDGNIYTKITADITDQLSFMADLQYRNVNYDITGTDDNMLDITQSYNYNFVNPKAGAFFKFNEHFDTYASFAIAQKEPKRSDYVDAPTEKKPVPEKLYDYEFGVHTRTQNFQLGVNLYYMYYKDQLINTGELNNVGSAIMVNTPKSYRKGIEITMAAKFDKVLDLSGNLAISRNKINNFTEYVAVYDESWNPQGTKVIDHGKSDIAYSPNVVANIIAKLHVTKDLDIDWTKQYVGKQYIDNTSSNDRVIDAYSFTNVKASYRLNIPHTKKSIIWAQVNNLFDQKYSSNAWVYSYYENDKRMDSIGLFPQAGINWTIGLSLSL